MRVIGIGFIRRPWFAKVAKAEVISMSVASPAPMAIGRYGGSSPVRPSLRAYSMPVLMPSACSVLMAGTLRLSSRAWRRAIGPSKR